MHLIALNGYKRSGKNTVAEFLSEVYGDGEGVVYQIGFADKVKILTAKSLGFTDLAHRDCIKLMDDAKERWIFEVRTEPDFPFHDFTGRELLQHVGTEARKLFGVDFWVDQVLPTPVPNAKQFDLDLDYNQNSLAARYPDVDCIAITDLRFPNEAQRVLDLGGEVWRINRPGCESDGHASEQTLSDDLVSREIDNSGDLSYLERQVEKALNELS